MPIDMQKLMDDLQRKLQDKMEYFGVKEKEIELHLKQGIISSKDYQEGRLDLRIVLDEIAELKEEIKEAYANLSV